MHNQDELVHLMMLQAQQQHQDMRLSLIGHIAEYDPQTHSATVYFPMLRDENDLPMKSPWIPLGSGMVGNGYGIQIAPHGGATPANPNQGEQVIVTLLDRETGAGAVANFHFTDQHIAPYDFGGGQTIQPGEVVIKHESLSYVRLRATGDIEVHSNRDIIATSGRDCNVTSTRNTNINATDPGTVNVTGATVNITADTTSVNVTSTTSANVTAGTSANVQATTNATVQAAVITNIYGGTQVNVGSNLVAFVTLLTSAFLAYYNTHTHTSAAAGVPTSAPIVPSPTIYPVVTAITAAN